MSTTLTEISAYVLWAFILSSIAYKLQNFGTPFGDSLSAEQKALMSESARKRMNFFVCAFVIIFIVIYVGMQD